MMPTTNTIRIVLATVLLLLVPLVAMQFTDEVAWDPSDFAVAGALLLGAGFTYEWLARRRGDAAYRAAIGIALATGLLLVWANLAVGIIGNEDNPANALYLGVLAVGLVGAAIARLEPRGMSRTLFATAVAQTLVPVVAMLIWRPSITPDIGGWGGAGVLGVVGLSSLFAVLFVASGWLFRRAARAREGSGVESAA